LFSKNIGPLTPGAVIVVRGNQPREVRIEDAVYIQKWFSDPVGVFMQE
jgi:hypothetical protein